MKILQEFEKFIMRGNVVDLAVGVVIGAAFGKIVTSFVSDILMPPIGLLLGNADFSDLAIVLKKSTGTDPDTAIRYGAFITSLIDFLIIAAAVFLVVKFVNRVMHMHFKNFIPTTKDCPMCASSIPMNAKKCGHCCTDL